MWCKKDIDDSASRQIDRETWAQTNTPTCRQSERYTNSMQGNRVV